MELRQLEYFLAISEGGSFSRAATVIGVAQPALSRQVKQLEEDLGVMLFYRHGRGVRLTREGEQFHAVVAPLLRDLSQIRSELREAARVPGGTVTLGMPPSMTAAVGARLATAFADRYPQVRLRLVEGLSGFVNEWLVAGRMDMAVLNNARRVADVRMEYLMTVDLFLFGRRRDVDALAPGTATFPTPSLAGLPLLLVGQNHGLRRELDAAARRMDLALDVRMEVDALAALKELVREGRGLTVLPQGVIEAEADDPAFASRRLVGPDLCQDFVLAYSLQRPTTLAMRELARQIRVEVARALAEGRLAGRVEPSRARRDPPPGGAAGGRAEA